MAPSPVALEQQQSKQVLAAAAEPAGRREATGHPGSNIWRVVMVLAGLGVAAMTDGPMQRVREVCTHPFAQGSAFCIMEEDARVKLALVVAACLFLIDVIVFALLATPSWVHEYLLGGVRSVYAEVRRWWRRRRKRQARETEKKERQKSREEALEVDRHMKRMAELEMSIKRKKQQSSAIQNAVKNKSPRVRRRTGMPVVQKQQHGLEAQPQAAHKLKAGSGQGEPPESLTHDIQPLESTSGLTPVVEEESYYQNDESLSVDGSDAGSEQSKVSTDSDKSRGSDEAQSQTRVVVEGVSHKLVAMLLVIIGIIGIAMVLETMQLAKQNREWSGTVDRAVGTDLIIHIAKVMHQTQKERGMTAIHVGSQGAELLFELGQQHAASDSAITGMVDALSRHISAHATHLHSTDAVSTDADAGGGYENVEATLPEPPSLTREKSRFDNAVRAVLSSVAELPKRRQCHIPRSVFTPQDLLGGAAKLPVVDPTGSASAAWACCENKTDCTLSPAEELEDVIAYYGKMHMSFITLATEMCTDFMTGVAPGVSNQLAPALFAFINLMVLKEKAGIERAIVSGRIALHDQQDPVTKVTAADDADLPYAQHARVPLATMVHLREVVAQQEGYRTAFFRFAPAWAADAYRSHRKEACVVESLRMRAVLLRPLRKTLGISIVEEDNDWSQVAHDVTKDDYTADEIDLDDGFFTAVDWFSNQTCRLDSLDAIARKLSWAIEADAKLSAHDAAHRLVWLVTPLGVSFAMTLVVAYNAMRTFCAFQDAAQARVASLTEHQTMYKTLAERWAPLSLAVGKSFNNDRVPAGMEAE